MSEYSRGCNRRGDIERLTQFWLADLNFLPNKREPGASISRNRTTETTMSKGTTMLKLRIHNLGDVAVLRCAGRITTDDRDRLRDAVLAQADIRVAVLDLADVTAVDAAGLGMLVALRAWADATGK